MPPSSRSIDGETLPVGVIGLTCTKVEGCFNWNKPLERAWAWSHSQTLPESGSGVLSDILVTWGRAYTPTCSRRFWPLTELDTITLDAHGWKGWPGPDIPGRGDIIGR